MLLNLACKVCVGVRDEGQQDIEVDHESSMDPGRCYGVRHRMAMDDASEEDAHDACTLIVILIFMSLRSLCWLAFLDG